MGKYVDCLEYHRYEERSRDRGRLREEQLFFLFFSTSPPLSFDLGLELCLFLFFLLPRSPFHTNSHPNDTYEITATSSKSAARSRRRLRWRSRPRVEREKREIIIFTFSLAVFLQCVISTPRQNKNDHFQITKEIRKAKGMGQRDAVGSRLEICRSGEKEKRRRSLLLFLVYVWSSLFFSFSPARSLPGSLSVSNLFTQQHPRGACWRFLFPFLTQREKKLKRTKTSLFLVSKTSKSQKNGGNSLNLCRQFLLVKKNRQFEREKIPLRR